MQSSSPPIIHTQHPPAGIKWPDKVPFVHPITAVVTLALMGVLPPDSRYTVKKNRVFVQDAHDFISNVPGLGAVSTLWFNRSWEGESRDNLNVITPSIELIGGWLYLTKPQDDVDIPEDDEDAISQAKKALIPETKAPDARVELNHALRKALELALPGIDRLNLTYSEDGNVKEANTNRKKAINRVKKNKYTREHNLSLIEQRLLNIWSIEEITQMNQAVIIAGQNTTSKEAQIKHVMRVIELKNREFEQVLNEYWQKERERAGSRQ